MPEWLPYSDQTLEAELAALIVVYYADEIGELCAGIQLTIQQHHEQAQI